MKPRFRIALEGAVAVACLATFLGAILRVFDLGGDVSWVTLLSACGLGVAVGRWWAIALAFAPLPLILAGLSGSNEDMAFGVFMALGLIAFAPAIAVGVAARWLAGRLLSRTGQVNAATMDSHR